MYEELNRHIMDMEEKLDKREKAQRLAKELEVKIQKLKEQRGDLEDAFAKAEEEYEKVHAKNFKGFLTRITGGDSIAECDDLYNETKQSLENCLSNLEESERQLSDLQGILRELEILQQERDALVTEKLAMMVKNDPTLRNKIKYCTEYAKNCEAKMRELDNVVAAIKRLRDSLEDGTVCLRSSQSWSEKDMMGEASLLAGGRSRAQEAETCFESIRYHAAHFREEVLDISKRRGENPGDLDFVEDYLLYFFPGFFEDSVDFQRKLEEAIDQNEKMISHVSSYNIRYGMEQAKLEKNIQEVEAEMSRIIHAS